MSGVSNPWKLVSYRKLSTKTPSNRMKHKEPIVGRTIAFAITSRVFKSRSKTRGKKRFSRSSISTAAMAKGQCDK